MHSLPDWRSRSQASSRAVERTAMVSGSKATWGWIDQQWLAIRVPCAHSRRGRSVRGGGVLLATIQFANGVTGSPIVCCDAANDPLQRRASPRCWRVAAGNVTRVRRAKHIKQSDRVYPRTGAPPSPIARRESPARSAGPAAASRAHGPPASQRSALSDRSKFLSPGGAPPAP